MRTFVLLLAVGLSAACWAVNGDMGNGDVGLTDLAAVIDDWLEGI